MFRFENPQYLYLLAGIAFLALVHGYAMYAKRKDLRTYGDPELLGRLFAGLSRWRPEVKFWLCQLALASFVVALARPQFGTRMEKQERQGIEALIALDVSNSMLAEDVKPNRLEKAKMMISNMVENMKDDKVGLIVYAGQAFTQLPITSDYVSARMFLETISPAMVSVQGTDIAAAIDLATRSFTSQEGVSRAIFVITDGEDNEGGAVEAARNAARKGMRVYVLGIGSPGGAPVPQPGSSSYFQDEEGNVVVSKLNEDMCREIAKAGNGSYIYVDNSSSAQAKLDEQVNRLARTRMESQVYKDYDEQFQGFVLLGLVFLLMDILLAERANSHLNLSRLFTRRTRP
ncbi:MAG TPA: hypothetical protein DC006_00660 [Prevotellaceae bacterium]|nr:hypothetical protein [Prevotellaceae bacterium]